MSTGLSSQACVPETFSFPDILGTQHASTTAAPVSGFTGFSRWKPEGSQVGPSGVSFCNVTVSYTHPGHEDLVTVHVWLPLVESSMARFVGVGGAGWQSGEIGDDIMSFLTYQGYATAATDGGYAHDVFGTADPWLMPNPGNLAYPLLANFAYRAVHEMTVVGKRVFDEYYGQPPDYSYWYGCSTGGRQGLTSAVLYPDDYDGLLTACPALNFPSLMPAMYWPQFAMNQIGAYPEACQFEAVRVATVEACDELDGVKDGIISRDDLCEFDPASVVGKKFDCNGSKTKISKEVAQVVKAMLQGPVDAEGNVIFPGSTHGTPATGMVALGNTRCDKGKCVSQPMTLATDWIRLLIKKDPSFDVSSLTLDEFARMLRQTAREYDGIFGADDSDLGQFRARGKKMITWHGINDEAITINAMRRYYDAVAELDGSRGVDTAEYYRYFEVPGANHCTAPEGVGYPMYALDALRAWVEEGVVPERLPTVVSGGTDEGQLVCPYPQVSVKRGKDVLCAQRSEDKAGSETKDEL